MNVKEIVINQIQEELKSGRIPWQSPYLTGNNGQCKCNLFTGHQYRGANTLLLAFNQDMYYGTFKQINEAGLKVVKGAKSNIIVFWKMLQTKDKQTGEDKNIPVLNYYRVFGVSQIDATDNQDKLNKLIEKRQSNITDNSEVMEVEDFILYTGARIEHNRNDIASYSPTLDRIQMPDINTMSCSDMYYSTLFHELTHWTGHTSRLNRLEPVVHKQSESYSKEELCAELGSCLLTAEFGLKVDYKNSAAYIQSWSTFINENQNAFFGAIGQADKAIDYLKELVVKAEDKPEVNPETVEVIEQPTSVQSEVKAPIIKQPVPGMVQAEKTLNCTTFKKYITSHTKHIDITDNEVKYYNTDMSVVIISVKVDTDKSYSIYVTPALHKDIKKVKGAILFRNDQIISDSIITGFDGLPKKDNQAA